MFVITSSTCVSTCTPSEMDPWACSSASRSKRAVFGLPLKMVWSPKASSEVQFWLFTRSVDGSKIDSAVPWKPDLQVLLNQLKIELSLPLKAFNALAQTPAQLAQILAVKIVCVWSRVLL